jgi:hypothetical protein
MFAKSGDGGGASDISAFIIARGNDARRIQSLIIDPFSSRTAAGTRRGFFVLLEIRRHRPECRARQAAGFRSLPLADHRLI